MLYKKGTRALSVREFEAAANETQALVIDTRDAETFAKDFVPNSINIGIDGNFATWVGTQVPSVKQELLIIADKGREEEVITRLARVGYDNALGYLKGGFTEWKNTGKETDSIISVSVDELVKKSETEEINILDARKASEYYSEHIIDAINTPLDSINDSMELIDKQKTYFVYCAAGYRSMIFISIGEFHKLKC